RCRRAAPPVSYTSSIHAALPIWSRRDRAPASGRAGPRRRRPPRRPGSPRCARGLRLRSRGHEPGLPASDPVQALQPAAPHAAPEHDHHAGGAIRLRPLELVEIVAAQEVEAPIPALDGSPHHHLHQHLADTRPRPTGIATPLVEVDGMRVGEPVPRRRRLPFEVERREPHLAPPGPLVREPPMQLLGARGGELTRPVPTPLVQRAQVLPAFLPPARLVVREHRGALAHELALVPTQRLTARAAACPQIVVPAPWKLEVGAAPAHTPPHAVPAPG